MSGNTFDAIVVGLGGMGSATLFELARRGRRVLGLEQFVPGHDQGSSHGHTRIIRQAYYEHPAYVPLVRQAYERWYDLEQRQGIHLLTTCPCLSVGPPDGELVQGVRRSAAEHSLQVENLDAAALRQRYPDFHFGDDYTAVVEPTAGFLYVEDCVKAHVREAERLGAVVHVGEPVKSWRADGDGVEVVTAAGRYSAARLVLTAGPWARGLLERVGAKLTVMRQVPLWFATSDDRLFRRDVFPVFIAETPEGHFYGIPLLDGDGVKVARHYGAPELRDPSLIDRTPTDADEVPVRRFLRAHLPAADGPCRRASVCIYTLTPDRHFIIDRHPDHANVAIAAGFSGHGFKFASVVGEILADLVETGTTMLPIDLFRIGRFAS
jgi:sarcosine oxidase